MSTEPVLRVAVPSPVARLFDYLPPVGSEPGPAPPGIRVRVPFGRKRLTGVVVATAGHSDVPRRRLRRADAFLDAEPTLAAELLELGLWAADYYHYPPGEALAALLPAALRRGDRAASEPPPRWQATDAGRETATAGGPAAAPVQARLLALIAAHAGGIDQATLRTAVERYHAPLKALAAKDLVEPAPVRPARAPPEPGPALSAAQARAVAAVAGGLDRFRPLLLHGVTGSGKTEVYLEAMRHVLDAGEQVLVLVPEIGLTPQLLGRVARRLATAPAVLHSGLTDRERLAAWRRAAAGDAAVVLGTRSAVFAPLLRPGLIVVDEEHDPSFKQQDGFRYHARDVAVARGQRLGIPVVLGSATPSLETIANARRGAYDRIAIGERAGGAQPPRLELIDIRRRRLDEGLSAPLVEVARGQLEAGGQVLLFLNRRGWAPTLICDDCGWTAECARCDARMTVHRTRARLRCHHCGADRPVPEACPDCGGTTLIDIGHGTERVEQAVAARFAGYEAVRIDRDSTRRRGALDAKLERVRAGHARILLGTQMLAKGHDFPGVGLVGILDADRGLFSADFRGPERLAQTVLQVAGRAGRAGRPGRVLIQTRNPEHPLLRALVDHGFDAVADALLAERDAAGLPPASHMALVRAESPDAAAPTACLDAARGQLEDSGCGGLDVLGPAPAPLERIAGRYRAQLALQARTRRPLHAALDVLRPWLETAREARRVRWSIDVDPVEML